MTDFLTIGFTILASCTTYFVCSTFFQKLEYYLRRQEQHTILKDSISVSRELRAWTSIFYPQNHNLKIQTTPFHLNTSPIKIDLNSHTPTTHTTTSNVWSTILPLLTCVTPSLINYFTPQSQSTKYQCPSIKLPTDPSPRCDVNSVPEAHSAPNPQVPNPQVSFAPNPQVSSAPNPQVKSSSRPH
jgi:hypothetical protein